MLYKTEPSVEYGHKIVKNEYIYIGSSTLSAKSNIYKVGRTKELSGRKKTYNSGRSATELMHFYKTFRVHNCVEAERRIHSLLEKWRPDVKKEMYVIELDRLVFYIDNILANYHMEVEFFNEQTETQVEPL